MNGAGKERGLSVDELRRAFDATFAAPAAAATDGALRYLGLRVGGDAYAVPIGEIGGFVAARPVVPIPTRVPELLGLSGVRGVVVPVYRLAALLGYEDDRAAARWFLLCGDKDVVALAFAVLDGYIELARDEVRSAAEDGGTRRHVQEVLRARGELRAVVSVRSLIAAVEERVAVAQSMREP